MDYQNIIDFWFADVNKPFWFNSTKKFDNQLYKDYHSFYIAASNGKLSSWQQQPFGALALVIILDQFPLNMFRGKPESFTTEAMSLEFAKQAISQGFDADLTNEQKMFLYMPYMHSEDLADQEQSLIMFNQDGLENNYKYAQHHYEIIKQFGRFPHRNIILGRKSSAEELEYLNSEKAFRG